MFIQFSSVIVLMLQSYPAQFIFCSRLAYNCVLKMKVNGVPCGFGTH